MSATALVVGLGQIGIGYDLDAPADRVCTHARAFSRHPAFALAAGVDPEPSRRALFERAYERPSYASIAEALAQHRVDVVAIAGPTRGHGAMIGDVLAHATPRAILCEKPLAHDVDEGRAIVRDCAAAGAALFVNYMRRSDPGAIEVRRRLDSGEIAGPVKGVAWYSKGFFHNGSHFFNLLEYWLGPVQTARVIDGGRLWNGEDPEPDVRVAFRGGDVTFLAAREEQFSQYTIELVAANGRLRYDAGGEQIAWNAARPDPAFSGYTVLSQDAERIESGMARYQWHVADELGRALAGDPYQLCSGDDALRTLEAMSDILVNTR